MKKIFLTGASAGIGQAIATILLKNGYEVWGTSRRLEKLPNLAHFHPVILDLTSPESVNAAFSQVSQESGGFDVLINNAGEGIWGALEGFTPEKFRQQFEVLVVGPHQLIQLALPGMRSRKAGKIINISSLAARFPVPFLGPYSAAKAALANYTATLRLELTGTGVEVIDLQPGDIATSFQQATEMNQSAVDSTYDSRSKQAWEVMGHHMIHGPGPEVVAIAVAKLIEKTGSSTSPQTVGTFYQAKFSPFLARILPDSLLEQGLRDYYKLR